MNTEKWLLCPACQSNTQIMVREGHCHEKNTGKRLEIKITE